jgi:ribosomal-protein-alanine N-acetyltransferase
MTAVVAFVCRFAFREFGLAKVTAHVFAQNEPSIRVLEKCGFEAEGYLRKHFLRDGQFHDAKVYGLLG